MRISDWSSDVLSWRCAGVHPTVYFEAVILACLVDHLAHGFDLAKLAFDEALPAKARIDAHDEDQIDVLDEIVQHLGRGGGIERHARLLAQGLDMLDCTVDMRPCFRMNRNDVCARLRKSFEILVHRRNHEMDVQGLGRMRKKRLHHGRAYGNLGDAMTVHEIPRDPNTPRPLNP